MATKGIAELITVEEALVRVDFADVEKVMRGSGRTHMSMVKATGENRALEVAEKALTSSLLDDNNINGAKEILLSFSVSDINTLTQDDITLAMDYIQKHASYIDEDGNKHDADIIWGASQKPALEEDELELVVVATRFTDGTKLNIEETYQEPEDPFHTTIKTPTEDELESKNPEPKISDKKDNPLPQRDNVTITPQKDKYSLVNSQKHEPAYIRQRVEFEYDNDTQARTTYQQNSAQAESDSQAIDNNGLFQQ